MRAQAGNPLFRSRLSGIALAAIGLLLAALGAPAAAPAAVPTVTIDPPTSVSYTSAQVSGTVDPKDQTVFYSFQYSTDQTEWGSAGFEAVASESGPTPVSTELTGLKPGTQYFVRLMATDFAEEWTSPEPDAIFMTDPVPPPAVSIDPVSGIGPHSARFAGSINPQAPASDPAAFDVRWGFECNPACPGLSGGIPADSVAHTVEADATGLLPGTEYEVSLVGENAGGAASAGPQVFATTAVAPEARDLDSDPLRREAALEAVLEPGGLATSYRFEYGTGAGYGRSTALRTTAATGAPVTVRARLSDLAPGTVYHWRLVANNSLGNVESADQTFATLAAPAPDTCPNAAIREQQASTFLTECRAYELITPMEKGGASIEVGSGTPVSSDGTRVAFTSEASFAGAQSNVVMNRFTASRGSDGWRVRNVNPPLLEPFHGNFVPGVATFSADFAKSIVLGWGALAPGATSRAQNLYVRDELSGAYRLVTPGAPERPTPFSPHYRAASADMSKVVFRAEYALTAGAPVSVPNLYEWDDGELRLASILPADEGGGPAPAGVESVAGEVGEGASGSGTGVAPFTVSDDGNLVFFSTLGTEQLYMRVGGDESVRLNASEASAPEPSPLAATFLYATPSGSRVYFTSAEKLVDEDDGAGEDLYAYDTTKPATDADNLTLLSRDEEPADGVESAVLGVIGAADDGSHVYFVAGNELTGGAESPSPEATENIYHWQEGELTFVAPLQGFDGSNWLSGAGRYGARRVTPDGEQMIFQTNGEVLNSVAPPLETNYGDDAAAIYRYSAVSGEVECVTCLPFDPDQAVGALFSATESLVAGGAFGIGRYLHETLNLSDDGRRVFFSTRAAMVPDDANASMDVYEWRDGQVKLISGGRGAGESVFANATADGRNVFFYADQQLVPEDRDVLYDLYAAPVGGGYPTPTPSLPCEGESCQPATPASQSWAPPASARVSGAGNAKRRGKAQCKKKARRHGQKKCRHKKRRAGQRRAEHRSAMQSARVTGRNREEN